MRGCVPSSRRTATPRPCGALGPLMPPSPPPSCEDHVCAPAVEPGNFLQGRCAPPRRPEPHPWLPSGYARRSGRGRACLRHGCGTRTPPRAWGLASGQPGCTGGRRDVLELRGNPHPELAVAVQLGCCELARLRAARATAGTVTGRRASPRRQQRVHPRLPGGSAVRRPRG
jgi:hypothetical protein